MASTLTVWVEEELSTVEPKNRELAGGKGQPAEHAVPGARGRQGFTREGEATTEQLVELTLLQMTITNY